MLLLWGKFYMSYGYQRVCLNRPAVVDIAMHWFPDSEEYNYG